MSTVLDEPKPRDGTPDATQASGQVVVSARAIGSVAYRAALEVYGIVELVPQDLRSRVVRRFGHAPLPDARDGVAVQMASGNITITLHVVIEYGLPVAEVAHNAIRAVYYAVEQAIGKKPLAVNVHVHGLRFSGEREAGAGTE